ncbi:MAG: aminoacyl-tRNA hydrolase [Coriobacteriia bacterium]|jgi:PTH1 family peptidyl-tRNA hydrolase|nr:aminoacyl-tRNA hydrolase [Coriobacteriia bacterium]
MSRLIVGLGNPGPEYEHTRHNAGFLVVDLLGENLRAGYWRDEAGSLTASVRVGDRDIVLAKPLTFMNVSGKALRKLADIYEAPVEEIIIVHDDIDLPAGDVRVKRGGGHGGHNGLRSITDQLGSADYLRVRFGVGRPPGRMAAADWVLQPLRGASAEEFLAVVPTAAQAVLHTIEHGVDSAMREFNAG